MAYQTIPSPAFREAFDSDLLLPGVLEEVFGMGADQVFDGISLLFNQSTMDQAVEYEELLSGVGRFQEWPDGEGVPYDAIEEVWKASYTYKWFANGVEFGKSAVLDLKYGVVNQVIQDMGYMWEVSKQEFVADWLESNPVQEAMDNKPIFADNHPLSPTLGSGVVGVNLVIGQLSHTTLRRARSVLYMTPNHRGVPLGVRLKRYVCHPERKEELEELVNSPDRPDTANRAKNTGYRSAPVEAWEHLQDEHAIYLVGEGHRFNFKTRQPKRNQTLYDDETWSMKHQVAGGYGVGLSDWRRIVKVSPS
jgi:hypothetical protein